MLHVDDIKSRDAQVILSELNTCATDLVPAFINADQVTGVEPDYYRLLVLRVLVLATEPIPEDTDVESRMEVMRPFVRAAQNNVFLGALVHYLTETMRKLLEHTAEAANIDDRLAHEKEVTRLVAAADIVFTFLTNVLHITNTPVTYDGDMSVAHGNIVDQLGVDGTQFIVLLEMATAHANRGQPFEAQQMLLLELWSLILGPYDPADCHRAKYPPVAPVNARPTLGGPRLSAPGNKSSLVARFTSGPRRQSGRSFRGVFTSVASDGTRRAGYGLSMEDGGLKHHVTGRAAGLDGGALSRRKGRVRAQYRRHAAVHGQVAAATIAERFLRPDPAFGPMLLEIATSQLVESQAPIDQDVFAFTRLTTFLTGFILARSVPAPTSAAAWAGGLAAVLVPDLCRLLVARATEYRDLRRGDLVAPMVDCLTGILKVAAFCAGLEGDGDGEQVQGVGSALILGISYELQLMPLLKRELADWDVRRGDALLRALVGCAGAYYAAIKPLMDEHKVTIKSKKRQNVVAEAQDDRRMRAEILAREIAKKDAEEARLVEKQEKEEKGQDNVDGKEEKDAVDVDADGKADPEADPLQRLVDRTEKDAIHPSAPDGDGDEGRVDEEEIELLREELEAELQERERYEKVAEELDMVRDLLHPRVVANHLFLMEDYTNHPPAVVRDAVRFVTLVADLRPAMLFALPTIFVLHKLAALPAAVRSPVGLEGVAHVTRQVAREVAKVMADRPTAFLQMLTPINLVQSEYLTGIRTMVTGATDDPGAGGDMSYLDGLDPGEDAKLLTTEAPEPEPDRVRRLMLGMDGERVTWTDEDDERLRQLHDGAVRTGSVEPMMEIMADDGLGMKYDDWHVQRRIFQLQLEKPTPADRVEYHVPKTKSRQGGRMKSLAAVTNHNKHVEWEARVGSRVPDRHPMADKIIQEAQVAVPDLLAIWAAEDEAEADRTGLVEADADAEPEPEDMDMDMDLGVGMVDVQVDVDAAFDGVEETPVRPATELEPKRPARRLVLDSDSEDD